jgi:dolichol-phosphate mannosyltransferase
VLEMDCDFSHDPADVPRLIATVEDGADLAIGSRYVPGGHVGDWGVVRRAISRGGSMYTAMFLRLGVKDPTAGFKCFRRTVLESIDPETITSRGYAFQIETTFRVKRAGFRVVEVPITFDDRAEGTSKMSRWIVLEAVWRVPLLRFRG